MHLSKFCQAQHIPWCLPHPSPPPFCSLSAASAPAAPSAFHSAACQAPSCRASSGSRWALPFAGLHEGIWEHTGILKYPSSSEFPPPLPFPPLTQL